MAEVELEVAEQAAVAERGAAVHTVAKEGTVARAGMVVSGAMAGAEAGTAGTAESMVAGTVADRGQEGLVVAGVGSVASVATAATLAELAGMAAARGAVWERSPVGRGTEDLVQETEELEATCIRWVSVVPHARSSYGCAGEGRRGEIESCVVRGQVAGPP